MRPLREFLFVPGLLGICWIFLLAPTASAGNVPTSSSEIQQGSLQHDGVRRTYLYYIPAALNTSHAPAPLVLVLHGGGGNAKSMVGLTRGRFNDLADRDGWIVVYPDGMEKHWNDGRNPPSDGWRRDDYDDVGFLSALLDKLIKEKGADPQRIYVTGMSNGALMANCLACESSDRIAAAAPVAGSLSVRLSGYCAPKVPVPILMINGDQDPLVPYQGGDIKFLWAKRGKVLPVQQAAEEWAMKNGCDLGRVKVTELPDRDPNDGTTVTRTFYGAENPEGEVLLYTVHGGGHTWPMGHPYLTERLVGKVSHEIDACDLIWEFFKRHHR